MEAARPVENKYIPFFWIGGICPRDIDLAYAIPMREVLYIIAGGFRIKNRIRQQFRVVFGIYWDKEALSTAAELRICCLDVAQVKTRREFPNINKLTPLDTPFSKPPCFEEVDKSPLLVPMVIDCHIDFLRMVL